MPYHQPRVPFSHIVWGIIASLIGVFAMVSLSHGGTIAFSYIKDHTARALASIRTVTPQTLQAQVPAVVFASAPETEPSIGRYLVPNTGLSEIKASAYLVGDIETGQTIIEKSSHKQFPIASVTKLFTALVAIETMNPNQNAIVSKDAANVESARGGLVPGEKISIGNLMYPLLLVSSNDAAEVIAEADGRDAFIEAMNSLAEKMKLDHTSFADPSGLSSENISTAHDLFGLLEYIKKNHEDMIGITNINKKKVGNHTWENKNHLKKSFEEFRGGKTGYTNEANLTSASFYDVPIEGRDRLLGIVILDSTDRTGDVEKLITFLTTKVKYETDEPKSAPIETIETSSEPSPEITVPTLEKIPVPVTPEDKGEVVE